MTRKKKKPGLKPTSRAAQQTSRGGVMQGMLRGFQTAAGKEPAGKKKKFSPLDLALTVVLLLALVAILYQRFGK